MQKTKTGDLRPMNFGSKFKDGSLRVDIPLESLHLLFNVNYAIVSQGRWSLARITESRLIADESHAFGSQSSCASYVIWSTDSELYMASPDVNLQK